MIEDELLKGAIDLHVHGFPEVSLKARPRVDDVELAQLARAAGMRAVVIKNSLFPTAARAYIITKMVPGIEIFGSVTLNTNLGGLSPFTVEASGELGAKVVWMPTWSSRNDLIKGGAIMRMLRRFSPSVDQLLPSPEMGITVLDGEGRLLPVVDEILQIMKRYDMIMASSHLSIEESLALAKACHKKGVKFILTHALNDRVNASIDQQKEIANMGGFIEHCYIQTMPLHQKLDIRRIPECIQAVGPENCVISTDAAFAYDPPAPEVLRMFIGSLLALGIDENSIRKMVQENPAKLLGLSLTEEKEAEI